MVPTVLLTNGQLRKTLSAMRSLGRRGIRTVVADVTRFTPSAYSKYCDVSLVYPNPTLHEDEFVDWLKATIRRYKCGVLFPMDDDVMQVVIRRRTELTQLCTIPLPPSDSYFTCADKGLAVEFAMQSNIDCPRTFIPRSVEELRSGARWFEFPMIVKPRFSSGSRGIRKVNSYPELEAIYHHMATQQIRVIVQEWIPTNKRYDVCLLFARDGTLMASFVQEELRHFPLEMGPSTAQKSVVWPDVVEGCASMMKKLGWYGVVELEFMLDARDGRLKFMEVNPRFWNSLHLAVVSGVDFPWMLFQVSMGEKSEMVTDYAEGVTCTSTLPGDILHFLYNKDRFKMNPPLFRWTRRGVYDDILSTQDPGPTVGFCLLCLRYAFNVRMWRFIFKR